MPADVITICNLALGKIGSPPITAIDDGSREARACALIFESCRDEVLQLRPWPSSVDRASLSLIDETPGFEYTSVYQLPPNFLDMVRLGDDDNANVPHKIEKQKRLLTNASTANILYIFRNEDPATYEPVLVDLIATRMAVDLALTVAMSTSLQESKTKQYEMQRQRARSVDGMTTGTPSFSVTTVIGSRA